MTFKMDIKRTLTLRSERVKSIDYHESEPWLLFALYNGELSIWNYENQQRIKLFEVSNLPVRSAKFVARKNWVICASDDMKITVYNYNNLEKVESFVAHSDYIRSLVVHPSQPYLLSSSDDTTIKLWNWDEKWICKQVYSGHSHYVMKVVINPRDHCIFASCSLDSTIKIWETGSSSPNFTLEGHEKGINCVDYYPGKDKPYLISCGDDNTVRIWDYQNKTCIQVLKGHHDNVSAAHFHPILPVIVTGAEDGNIVFWSSISYNMINTFNYGFERCWCISHSPQSNNLCVGYDGGSIELKIGQEEPPVSMDSVGQKIIWSVHSEIKQANINHSSTEDTEIIDGCTISCPVKDMGICELYPERITHSFNGRFVAICGNGEYIIYTAMALRCKSFGSAKALVWSSNSLDFATYESYDTIKIFKNFKESREIKIHDGIKQIFGGHFLGVTSIRENCITFYDWDDTKVQCIEVDSLRKVYWSGTANMVCLACETQIYILKLDHDLVALNSKAEDDDVKNPFEFIVRIEDKIISGVWIEDTFLYNTSSNQLNYLMGSDSISITYLDKLHYVLGYIKNNNRLYLMDKDHNIISYSLLSCVLEYQSAILNDDFEAAEKVLPLIPDDHKTKVAYFLEKQGHKKLAFDLTLDPEHKFALAMDLQDIELATSLATSKRHWLQIANAAIASFDIDLAIKSLRKGNEPTGLLLLGSSTGDEELLKELDSDDKSAGSNLSFLLKFLLGDLDGCLDILIGSDLPMAAFFARSYVPSRINEVVSKWKSSLESVNTKVALSIADPENYINLFPELDTIVTNVE